MTVAGRMEPQGDQADQEHGHRRRPLDRLRQSIGGILEAQHLFAVFESDFDGPTAGISGQDLPGSPVHESTVEDA